MRTLLCTSICVLGLTFAPLTAHSVGCWTVGMGVITTTVGVGAGAIFGSMVDEKSQMPAVYGAIIGGVIAVGSYIGIVALSRRCASQNPETETLVSSDSDT